MGPAALHSSNQCCIIHIYLNYLGLCLQARSLVCAPMENCYSNLMHEDGKGLLSLILSLIGLNVNPSVCPPCVYSCDVLLPVPFVSTEMNWNPILVPDRHISGPDEGFLERDAAVRPAGAAVCWQESVGGGAAVRSAPEGQRSRLCDGTLPGSLAAGYQAGEGHLQRWVKLRIIQKDELLWVCERRHFPSHFVSACHLQARWIWPTAKFCTKTSPKVLMVFCSTASSTWSTWSHPTIFFPSANLNGWRTSDRSRLWIPKVLLLVVKVGKPVALNIFSLFFAVLAAVACRTEDVRSYRGAWEFCCQTSCGADGEKGGVRLRRPVGRSAAAATLQNDNALEAACCWVSRVSTWMWWSGCIWLWCCLLYWRRQTCGAWPKSSIWAVASSRRSSAPPRPSAPACCTSQRWDDSWWKMIPGLLNEQCFLHARIQELEEFWPFKALLTELMRRLSYCVTAELIPLMEVVGVMEVSVERREDLLNSWPNH